MRQEQSAEYSGNIICPGCKAVGVVTWETTGGERSFVGLSRNFYERISKKKPYDLELVCHKCGKAQPLE